ncbi:hypothetical protein HHK36_015640 [Tetracentron sinense]|uniref:Uncharacterized protein n=1 Tax=Tetracentron sinense TaxID=13715 RepID=A0A834Z3G2_TETSI|nr:hypothetical protein HHK36_015640 [Tetracentron sinense]
MDQRERERDRMAMASNLVTFQKVRDVAINGGFCHKGSKFSSERKSETEITSPTKLLKLRHRPRISAFVAFPPAIPPQRIMGELANQKVQCGESVTIEGQSYTISAVIHQYQLWKGKYESSEKKLDVQSTGRYILNLYLENLPQQS